MTLSFICRLKEKTENGYNVYLNASNINNIPTRDNVTIRRVYTTLELTMGMYFIIGDIKMEGTDKKLIVSSCYSLTEVEEPKPLSKEEISIDKALQDVILNKSSYPCDLSFS